MSLNIRCHMIALFNNHILGISGCEWKGYLPEDFNHVKLNLFKSKELPTGGIQFGAGLKASGRQPFWSPKDSILQRVEILQQTVFLLSELFP